MLMKRFLANYGNKNWPRFKMSHYSSSRMIVPWSCGPKEKLLVVTPSPYDHGGIRVAVVCCVPAFGIGCL